MLLESPKDARYPWIVTDILKNKADDVEKGTALFWYSVEQLAPEFDADGVQTLVKKNLLLEFKSATDGKILRWKIRKGDIVAYAGVGLIEINEPCSHEIQFGGMCANCGKDMSEGDYITKELNAKRAGVSMAHTSMELKVSKKHAAKEDDDSKRSLLQGRRLVLVVDLDLTVIHATVDPTVGEWQNDPQNPNYEAVKGVRSFELVEMDVHKRIKRKSPYYVKLRPGLKDFLQNISKLYELHIYTMGTRGYAKEIAKIIDPDEKLFGQRILSRDENGIVGAKSLQRLFPTDTKMVVIIDDREDVWNWSDNQVKVKPYDFFVGIGDIHGRFAGPAVKGAKSKLGSEKRTILTESTAGVQPGKVGGVNGASSSPEQDLVTDPSTDLAILEQKSVEQDEDLVAQVNDRPLLQRQQILDQEEIESKSISAEESGDDDDEHPKHRHNLLQDDDVELFRLEEILQNIHTGFYDAFDRNRASGHDLRVARLRGERTAKKRPVDDLEHLPDVQDIMVAIRKQTLEDVVMTVSGLWAQHMKPLDTPLGQNATKFGAILSDDITGLSTHLISRPDMNTAKVKLARKHRVKVVTEEWINECVNRWSKVDETPYLIYGLDAGNDDLAELHALQDEAEASDDGGANEANDAEIAEQFIEPDVLLPVEPLPVADENPLKSPMLDMGDLFASGLAELEDESEDSQDESDASDTDSVDSDASDQKDRGKKRKRNTESVESTDAEDSDASTNDKGSLGSELQRRKRKAFARVSSLTHSVKVQDTPTPSATTPDSLAKDQQSTKVSEIDKVNDEEGDEDDAAFTAAFEQELEAQLNADRNGGDEAEAA